MIAACAKCSTTTEWSIPKPFSFNYACLPKIDRTYKQHCAGATTFSEPTLQQDLVLCSDFYVSSGLRYLWRPVAVKTVTAPNLVAKAGAMSSGLPSSRCSPGALLRMQLNLQICSIVSKTRLRFRFTDNNMDELFSVGRHIFQRNVTYLCDGLPDLLHWRSDGCWGLVFRSTILLLGPCCYVQRACCFDQRALGPSFGIFFSQRSRVL